MNNQKRPTSPELGPGNSAGRLDRNPIGVAGGSITFNHSPVSHAGPQEIIDAASEIRSLDDAQREAFEAMGVENL